MLRRVSFSFLQKLMSGTEPSIKIKVGFPNEENCGIVEDRIQ